MKKENEKLFDEIFQIAQRISSLYDVSFNSIFSSLIMCSKVISDIVIVEEKRNLKILDIGCNRGYGTYFLAKHISNSEVLGVDIKRDYIETARNLFNLENLKFKVLDATSSNIPSHFIEKFDIVTCFEVFEHIKLQKHLIINVRKMLSKNGALYVSTPNKVLYDVDAFTPSHTNEVDIEDFVKILKNNGMVVERIYGIHRVSKFIYKLLHKMGLSARVGDSKNELEGLKLYLRKTLLIFDKTRWYRKLLDKEKYYKWYYKSALNKKPESSVIMLAVCRKIHDQGR